MRIIISFIVISILPFIIPAEKSSSESENYKEYCNARYDFCVAYPASMFEDKELADNGDGITLYGDESIKVTVSGSWDVFDRNSTELYQDISEPALSDTTRTKLLYTLIKDDIYETSFIKEDRQIYHKLFDNGAGFVLLQVNVPVAEAYKIESVVNDLSVRVD